ncbi:serine protease 1-like [Eurosta solidaginis]|uniref:serine protease 1-like n=1 Tax=Eurosta solidaginis TaxID=178769 RepID=UPI00353162FB
MAPSAQQLSKTICKLIILLVLTKYVRCNSKIKKKDSDVRILGKSHDHREDFRYPLPEITVDKSDFTMLVAGGYRPSRIVLSKYIVSIRTSRATFYFGDNHFCVGVIISEQLVLTAAHCVVDRRRIVTRPHRLLVVAGAPNRLLKTYRTVERKVIAVIPHDKYVRKGLHDIAILRLKTRLPDDNQNIKIISLIDEIPKAGTNCQLVGWGQIFFRGPYTAVAVQANLTVISGEDCKRFYTHKYDESLICAGHATEWDIDACRGDSGGPLICNGVVAGIVSWSSHCGEKGKPTIFTSIYHHRIWINFASEGSSLNDISFINLLLFVLVTDWVVVN